MLPEAGSPHADAFLIGDVSPVWPVSGRWHLPAETDQKRNHVLMLGIWGIWNQVNWNGDWCFHEQRWLEELSMCIVLLLLVNPGSKIRNVVVVADPIGPT